MLGFIFTVFIVATSLLIIGIIHKFHINRHFEERIKELPTFSFQLLNKKSFSSCEIKEGPLLVVHFHPECEHCQYEIAGILKSKIIKPHLKVLLIANANPDSVIQFMNRFPISETQDVITLIDTANAFKNSFGETIVPSNYLYDKDLKLIKVLYGEYKLETIMKLFDISEPS